MNSETASVLLATVAIEPSRWAGQMGDVHAPPPISVSEWMDSIGAAGFDGIEIWERHLTEADTTEVDAVLNHVVPISVFNSYTSLDEPDGTGRSAAAAWATRAGSAGIKYNVGNKPDSEGLYADRIAEWLDSLADDVALLCECHHGISIAEDPAVAARIFDAAGPADRVQAIVHTHEDPDHIRARFDAYGDRISHVHVNFLDFTAMTAPRLIDIRDRLVRQVDLLASLGFAGSWTIEFTHGLLSDDDNPSFLLARAAEDLDVLRELIS